MPEPGARAPYRIHRMIQDLVRDPAAARGFADDPQPVFDRYGIAPGEVALLEERSIAGMTQLGVHPNLQMKYLRLRRTPNPGASGALDAYLDRLQAH